MRMPLARPDWEGKLKEGTCDGELTFLYGDDAPRQVGRYLETVSAFRSFFGAEPSHLISVGGRTELCGNHTDHQNGCVLAAAVTRDMLAAVTKKREKRVRLLAPPFGLIEVSLEDLDVQNEEAGRPQALLRGVVAFLKKERHTVGGCDIYLHSEVPIGSGLSSSAAFEVLTAYLFSLLFNDDAIAATVIARAGQYAENHYFDKPCGLMDQLVCASGGSLQIDFKDPANPDVKSLTADFDHGGYGLYLVNAGGSHAHLTEAYAAIPKEMSAVAQALGQQVLRQVDPSFFYANIKRLRSRVTDRAILRAKHYFEENDRVSQATQALRSGDMDGFRQIMDESGRSSLELLQNVWPQEDEERSLALALAVSRDLLGDLGACRVHGGGFAGTIQALVPSDLQEGYKRALDDLFGQGACRKLRVRPVGGYELGKGSCAG